ncbi:DUF424 domain-containing protein [Halobaculum sp. MBLA0143]|uniref:DUF424 domain-containing protein n=1 Tax=Halobaculum sp. MBLA0143 TaxID=3079933 RepID=UPI0035257292
MTVVVTVRETPEGTLVAAADNDCLGETYEDGAVSLTVEESFYAGDGAEELEPEAAVERVRDGDTANLVGEACVEAALAAGVVDESGVLEVDGTLHAQVVWL